MTVNERLIRCVRCQNVTEFDGDQYLEVSVEIAWANSSGRCPDGFGVSGLCDGCADFLFNALANTLRREIGASERRAEDEPALHPDEDEEVQSEEAAGA